MVGYGPCYHFIELFKHPKHIETWLAAGEGKSVDFEKLLTGYQSGLDFPLVTFYKELIEIYPNAKVILTVREPEKWYQSTLETIYQGPAIPGWMRRVIPIFQNLDKMVNTTIWDKLFEGRFEEKAYAIEVFNLWIEEVKRNVSPERLLVFSVKDGWEPLCNFLDVPVPDKAFPHVNDRKSTKAMYAVARVVPIVLLLEILGFLVSLWN